MDGYDMNITRAMRRFFATLSEKDRRRYAAVEALKLGHGGTAYIADILRCDPKTIRQGIDELNAETDPADGRVRKKGAAESP